MDFLGRGVGEDWDIGIDLTFFLSFFSVRLNIVMGVVDVRREMSRQGVWKWCLEGIFFL